MDRDQKIANDKFEKILESIQSKNEDMMISVFSKESLKKIGSLDESVNALFDYFNGTVESYDDWVGPFVETTKENDQTIQIMEATYDVKTTECTYRFAIRYLSEDTENANNIGVQSLYVIKMEDDIGPEYAYWGDGKFTSGIHIGVPNIE